MHGAQPERATLYAYYYTLFLNEFLSLPKLSNQTGDGEEGGKLACVSLFRPSLRWASSVVTGEEVHITILSSFVNHYFRQIPIHSILGADALQNVVNLPRTLLH